MRLSELDSERVHEVALFGATGCGKSSIINLLLGKPVADVSTGVGVCTRRPKWFPALIEEKAFRLWDTMGFNQGEAGIDPLSPYEQAHTLLRNLDGGIDLILLCARKDGIDAALRDLYWLLDSFFFGGEAQIALVLTHFDVPDEDWWDRNVHIVAQRCHILAQFIPYACITTVQDGSPQSDSTYEQSKQTLRALLHEHAGFPTELLDLSSDTIEEVAEGLKSHSQLNIHDAITLVERFRSPTRPFHAILFGDAGTGKSSVINLTAGRSVASVSSALQNCTLSSHCYETNTGLHQFLVWDTVGFNGMYQGKDATAIALEDGARLVRDVHNKGGVDLLVFCRKGDRLSPTELNCFRLFHEFLCEGQIPVAFIITHLESYHRMEGWWEEKGEGLLKMCGLKTGLVAGHACITAAQVDPGDQTLRYKRLLSMQLVQTMLEDSISTFNKDGAFWATPFLKRFGEMGKGNSTRKKVSVTRLVERCGLTRGQADELIRLLTSRDLDF